MSKFLSLVLLVGLSVVNYYCLWVYALGGTVRSWPWFIACGLVLPLVLRGPMELVVKEKP